MYDVIVYSGTVLPALGPFKKISLSGYSTLIAPMGLRISYHSVVIRCPKKGAEPVTLKMMRLLSLGCKQKQKTQTMCKNPTLFWSQSVTPLRPPTASQWAAVRITTEACRRSNPHGVIPAPWKEFSGKVISFFSPRKSKRKKVS